MCISYWYHLSHHGNCCIWGIMGICCNMESHVHNSESLVATTTLWMGSTESRNSFYSFSTDSCWTLVGNTLVPEILLIPHLVTYYSTVLHLGRSDCIDYSRRYTNNKHMAGKVR